MSAEIRINSSLQITSGQLQYQSRPNAFTVDMETSEGPSPGYITATVDGVDVDLSNLSTPGVCRIMNLESTDLTNYITYGIWDPEESRFFPLGEVGPGESWIIKLSQSIQQEWVGTGTGTGDASENRLRIKAAVSDCGCLVEAFGR